MKDKLKISTNLRGAWVYLLVGLVGFWYLAGLTRQLMAGGPLHAMELFLLGVLIMSVIWYVLHLRMDIKVGRKSLKVKSNQWWGRRAKIKWRDVVKMESFHIPEALMWTGYSINFSPDVNQFRLGDNKGIKVEMESGETFLIYSSDLYERFDQLKDRWQAIQS
mgnify:CR=1 FL=1